MHASLSDAATSAHALTASVSRLAGTRASLDVVPLGESAGGDAFVPLDCELGVCAPAVIAVASAAAIKACLKSVFIDFSPSEINCVDYGRDGAIPESRGTSGEYRLKCRSEGSPAVGKANRIDCGEEICLGVARALPVARLPRIVCFVAQFDQQGAAVRLEELGLGAGHFGAPLAHSI
jgi:hypothetical protein